MGVTNSQLLDLLATTLEDLPKGEAETMWDSQNLIFARIYNSERKSVDGGTSIVRNVILDHSGHAKYRRLFETDEPTVENIHKRIEVPWVQLSTDFSWDVSEIRRNAGSGKQLVSLAKTRRLDGFWSFAELFESRGWKTPTNASDTLFPYGVPYYLNMLDAGATSAGFNGQTIRFQDGTTGTVCAGLDAATEPKWRNYAATYNKVDNNLLRTMREAVLRTRFQVPPGAPDLSDNRSGAKEIYCNADIAVEFMDLADKRDDNSAPKDLAGKVLVNNANGLTMFNGMPVVYAPHLDGEDYDPIYCVNWSKIVPVVEEGNWMQESEPMKDRGQHTTLTVYVDSGHNNLCTNRREAGFVIHKPIPAD